MKTFGAENRKSALKMIKKHYLEKVFATRFQNVKKPYKTNGNTVSQNASKTLRKQWKCSFSKCKNVVEKPNKTL